MLLSKLFVVLVHLCGQRRSFVVFLETRNSIREGLYNQKGNTRIAKSIAGQVYMRETYYSASH